MQKNHNWRRMGWMAAAILVLLLAVNLKPGWTPAQTSSRERCEADPAFRFIPAGAWISGSDRAERDYGYQISAEALANRPKQVQQIAQKLRQQAWFEREMPRQMQSLPAFCISRNLVTNADYQAFVQATGHPAPGISAADYQQQGFLVHPYEAVRPYLWQENHYPAGMGQHPVVLVTYSDALAFAKWKGQQDQQIYSLPTAAAWEKAARGTDGRYFTWGNQWRNDATNWGNSAAGGTSAVAAFPLSRSVYGVEDMAGNLFEYSSTLQQQGTQTVAVMKGCAWDDSPGFCRAAYQHQRPIQSRHILFGFRLVRE